jgi:RNA polymerase primary sigma factor
MSLRNTMHWINQKDIQSHLFELRKYPPMTREEELIVIQQVAKGDEKAKEKLILANLRFVVSMAKKYQNQGMPLNDVISEGNLGLVKAAERYTYDDPQVRFLSYAVHWIKQAITEGLMQNSRTIRLPANQITLISKSGSEPLADTTHDYTLTFPKMLSFDVSVDDDGNTLHEVIADENTVTPDNDLDNPGANIRGCLSKILSFLKGNERTVIIKAFGLDGTEPWTLQDIAEELDLTKERVRQIKERSLKKLRSNATFLMELID